MMTLISILTGLALLLFGRKIYWLVVATVGFIVGMKLAALFVDVQSQSTLILIAIGSGLLFALFAVILQKIAVGLAGFIAGGYGAFIGIKKLGLHPGDAGWALMLIAGVLGAIIAAMLFEWALILLSSFVGAYLLVDSFGVNSTFDGPLFVVFSIVGIVVQAKSKKKGQPKHRRKSDDTTVA